MSENIETASTTPAFDGDREAAIRELLSLYSGQDLEIPDSLRARVLGNDGEGQIERTASEHHRHIMTSLVDQRASELLALQEGELFLEIHKFWRDVKAVEPSFDLRVINGSYTIQNPVSEQDQQGDGDGPARAKQKIETVRTESPLYKMMHRIKRIVKTKQLRPKMEEKVIMDGVNLNFESGKLYLVLGAPGAGKSTLLKMIADTLRRDKTHVVGGDVFVNGISPNHEKGKNNIYWSNLVAYIDQIDRLHKYLTVYETCRFAWKCRSGGTHAKPNFDMDDPEVQKIIEKADEDFLGVNWVLEGMGLARVRDTFVGDNVSVRGVSGGEKKRVTVSEMMCVGAPVLCCDEISTGLDAATTYDIVKLLGAVSRLTGTIKIISLLQPPPETVALFDDLILIDKGRVIYSGPVGDVVEHFESLGYKIPDRMDTADWLQALPTRDGAQYLVDNDGEENNHLSTEDFVERYVSSDHGKRVTEILEQPVQEDSGLREGQAAKRFSNPWTQSLNLLVRREMLLWWRDRYMIRARFLQDLIMGIVAGTLFWQEGDDPQSVMGILFQSMFFVSIGAMLKVPEQFETRGVLYKQQDANFYPTWTFVFGRSLASVPSALIDGILYGSIIYWFVGLAGPNDSASVGNYFLFMLLVIAGSLSAGLMFSVFSATVKDRPTAQAGMSITVVLFVLFSGFTVQPDLIPAYWIWIYWSNMFAWVLRSLVVNEFLSGKWDEPVPGTGQTQGETILTNYGFTLNGEPFTFEWVWYGLVFAVGISAIAMLATVYFLQAWRFETGKSLATNAADGEDAEVVEEEVQLPFQRVDLTFRDIHYTVTASTSNETLELLKGIDGYLEAGKMTALMGSSGAGKTTLMDVLALRKTSGEITGDVRLNGHPQEADSFRRCTGYVEQFDEQSPQLTIRETVDFSAKLRLDETDPAVTPESTKKFVDQTLAMLELTTIQDLQVGDDLTGGLSFEQKKRLSIAVEVVANPSILFLDEPTSGLDARAASIVMRGLKRIAEDGRAVCATIHQPSIAIFQSFDSLLLLKRGGETVFFGDLGDDSANLIEYLERYPATPKIEPGENPATWMLTTIGAGSSSSGTKPFDYSGSYADSKLREKALRKIGQFDAEASDDNLVSFPNKYATSRATQRRSVLVRTLIVYWRSPTYNLGRMIVAAVVALLFGSCFASQRTPNTEGDMNSRVTSIFITFIFIAVNAFNTVLSVFEVERNMFYRHKAALMYSQRAILLAFTVAEIPFILVSSMIFVVCFYFLVGFATAAYKFWLYYLFFTLNMGLFTFLGQMFMSLVRDSATAQGFGGLTIGLTSLFSGLLLRPQNINGFWIFAYWLLPGHYVLESLVTSQFYKDETPITPSAGSPFCEFVLETPECQELQQPGEIEDCTICTGTAEEWVGVSFGGEFRYENIPWNLLYMVGVTVVARIITYIALTRLNYLAK